METLPATLGLKISFSLFMELYNFNLTESYNFDSTCSSAIDTISVKCQSRTRVAIGFCGGGGWWWRRRESEWVRFRCSVLSQFCFLSVFILVFFRFYFVGFFIFSVFKTFFWKQFEILLIQCIIWNHFLKCP